MDNTGKSLPSNVLDAMRGGNTIEAIKRLRQATGLGLKEARDLVEAHARGKSGTQVDSGTRTTVAQFLSKELPPQLVEAVQRGSVLEAIKLLREHQGLGLKEAKAAVEKARPPALGLADGPPDTFHRVVNAVWWLLALALTGVVAYYFLRDGR